MKEIKLPMTKLYQQELIIMWGGIASKRQLVFPSN